MAIVQYYPGSNNDFTIMSPLFNTNLPTFGVEFSFTPTIPAATTSNQWIRQAILFEEYWGLSWTHRLGSNFNGVLWLHKNFNFFPIPVAAAFTIGSESRVNFDHDALTGEVRVYVDGALVGTAQTGPGAPTAPQQEPLATLTQLDLQATYQSGEPPGVTRDIIITDAIFTASEITNSVLSQIVNVTVPDVVGLTQAQADALIVAANLTPGNVTSQTDNSPSGTVLSQTPLAGSVVPQGSTVDLVVSSGPGGGSNIPYPLSTLVTGITWDPSSLFTTAFGSDLFPVAHGPGAYTMTSFGDGGGFPPGTNTNGRVAMGFGRITGQPPAITTQNIHGGANAPFPSIWPAGSGGKTAGIIAVDGVLYAWINTQNTGSPPSGPPSFGMARSSDGGETWEMGAARLNSGSLALATFVNYGQDYQDGDPNFVYAIGGAWGNGQSLFFARAPRSQIWFDDLGWEFCTGLDAQGNPNSWSPNTFGVVPIFTDPNANSFNGSLLAPVVHLPGMNRFILTMPLSDSGGLGVFDAPNPWGPWTTVDYYDDWEGIGAAMTETLSYNIGTEWWNPVTGDFWMTYSAGGIDSFNLIRGTFQFQSGGGVDFVPSIFPLTLAPGETVTVQSQVTNNTGVSVQINVTVDVPELFLSNSAFGTVNPGETVIFEVTHLIPPSTPSQTITVNVSQFVNGSFQEGTSEQVQVAAPAADFTLTGIIIDPGLTVNEGEAISFEVFFQNVGNAAGLGQLSLIRDGAQLVDQSGQFTVQPGEILSTILSDIPPSQGAHDYTIQLINPSTLEIYTTQDVTITVTGPSIVYDQLSISPVSALAGEVITFQARVTNNGSSIANCIVSASFIGRGVQDSDSEMVSPGNSFTFSIDLVIPISTPSGITFDANLVTTADGNTIPPGLTEQITVLAAPVADIMVQNAGFSPTSVFPGDTITVDFEVINVGDLEGSYGFFMERGGATVASAGQQLLAAGNVDSYAIDVLIPSSTAPGILQVLLSVTNGAGGPNWDVVTFDVDVQPIVVQQAELVLEGITVSPPSAFPGEQVTVQVTFGNIGTADGGYFIRGFLDGVEVANTILPATQAAGNTGTSRNLIFTVPESTPPGDAVIDVELEDPASQTLWDSDTRTLVVLGDTPSGGGVPQWAKVAGAGVGLGLGLLAISRL